MLYIDIETTQNGRQLGVRCMGQGGKKFKGTFQSFELGGGSFDQL